MGQLRYHEVQEEVDNEINDEMAQIMRDEVDDERASLDELVIIQIINTIDELGEAEYRLL